MISLPHVLKYYILMPKADFYFFCLNYTIFIHKREVFIFRTFSNLVDKQEVRGEKVLVHYN
ncbi:MAG TPA: hypothetical protein DC053_18050 [Lachnoclostridium sp.]|nr:hypothetical protein [Lachnoclostridium sp.]